MVKVRTVGNLPISTTPEVEELKRSVERLQVVIDEAPIGIVNVDLRGKITYVNRAILQGTGYSRDELVGKSAFRLGLIPREALKLLGGRMQEKLMGKPPSPLEMQFKRRDGTWMWVEITGRALQEHGVPVGVQIVGRDVTKRKQAEEALQQSEERLKTYIESAPDGVYINDLKGTFLYGNRKAEEIIGHKKEELLGKSFLKLNILPAKYLAKAGKLLALNTIGKPTGPDEFELIKKDGSRTWVEITTTPVKRAGGKTEVVGFVRDITERKQAEEASLESEERFRSIVENSHDGIMILDDAYRLTYVNDELCRMSGYSREEVIGQDFREFLDEESKQLVADRYIRRQKGEEVPPRYEFNIVRKDGQKRRVEISSSVIKDSAGRVKTVAQILDITERKEAEEALKLQKAYFQQLFDDSPDAIAMWDDSGRVFNVNKGFEALFGYRAEEVKGRRINDIVIPEDRTEEASTLSQAVLSNEAQRIETVRKRKDGSLVDVSLLHFPIRFGNKTVGVYTIYTDITERKRMEREIQEKNGQLIRSERLAAIGQLAGGVGHELRNPLSAIKNAVYYIKGKVASSELGQREPRVMEFLDIIDDEINSSSKIITDLLGFSRVGKPSVSPARIDKVIEDALSHTPIPENIELTKKLDAGLPEINIDPDQIGRVVVNIITNAVEAMPEGGRLLIAAREKDKFLEVEVSDTGCGIPQESMDKIFDPLFTTKAKGIGLGLAVCKAIIDRHEGNIAVKSKVGEGTTFSLRLPLGRNIGGN